MLKKCHIFVCFITAYNEITEWEVQGKIHAVVKVWENMKTWSGVKSSIMHKCWTLFLNISHDQEETLSQWLKWRFVHSRNNCWKDGGLSSGPARPACGLVPTQLCRRTGGPVVQPLVVQSGCQKEPVRFCLSALEPALESIKSVNGLPSDLCLLVPEVCWGCGDLHKYPSLFILMLVTTTVSGGCR